MPRTIMISLGEIVDVNFASAVGGLGAILQKNGKKELLCSILTSDIFKQYNIDNDLEKFRSSLKELMGGIDIPEEDFKQLWNSMVTVSDESIELLKVLTKLKQQGENVIITSDTNSIHVDYIVEMLREKDIDVAYSYNTDMILNDDVDTRVKFSINDIPVHLTYGYETDGIELVRRIMEWNSNDENEKQLIAGDPNKISQDALKQKAIAKISEIKETAGFFGFTVTESEDHLSLLNSYKAAQLVM